MGFCDQDTRRTMSLRTQEAQAGDRGVQGASRGSRPHPLEGMLGTHLKDMSRAIGLQVVGNSQQGGSVEMA